MPKGIYERTPQMLTGRYPRTSEMRTGKHGNQVTGEKHHNWSGDQVGYYSLHKWVARHAGKAQCRPCAHKDETCGGRLEWANVSGEYLRDLADFMPLCKSHHAQYDS